MVVSVELAGEGSPINVVGVATEVCQLTIAEVAVTSCTCMELMVGAERRRLPLEAKTNVQLVLLLESVQLLPIQSIAKEFVLLEYATSINSMSRVA